MGSTAAGRRPRRTSGQRLSISLAAAALVAGAVATATGIPAAASAPHSAASSSAGETFDAVPALTASTFADPPQSVRPQYYWWQPAADTDDAELAHELKAMAQTGAGGALIVPQRGNSSSTSYLEKYGWGTPLWAHKLQTMLTAAHDNRMQLQFSQGPLWPAVVPSVTDVNNPAAMQQLIFSYEFHPGGTSRTGPLPTNFDVKPPAGANKTLVAALVARCAQASCATQSGGPKYLEQASVVDVTDKIDAAGNLQYDFPGDSSSSYALIAFYQTATGDAISGAAATGKMYYLDHLSVAGAKATTDYFDTHNFTPQVQALITANDDANLPVGFYENSLELGDELKWTWNFAQEFQDLRGYSVISDLPALAAAPSYNAGGQPATRVFDFAGGAGDRIRNDYMQTVSDLYIKNHMDTLRAWAHSHGLYTDSEAYGIPLDVTEASAHVDAPGQESHHSGDDGQAGNAITWGQLPIEEHKLAAVGAHMNGTSLVDDECCAMPGDAWASTTADGDGANLPKVYDALAGGSTRIVWHGFPYLNRTTGAQSVWPGMSYGGNTSYAEAFGPNRNPNWADYRKINDNLARLGLVLRQGQPRLDVAVYLDGAPDSTGHATSEKRMIPTGSAMTGAGYTYEYLSPAFLDRTDATFRDGRLFPDTAAYKALVLNNQDTMSIDAASKILERAKEGLPVVIIGSMPSSTPGYRDAAAEDRQLQTLMTALVAEPTVTRVASQADVPAALRALGVQPAAAHQDQSPAIVSVRRQAADTDYYFLYNQTPTAADETITLSGEGAPYQLDTWTGKISGIADYTRGQGTITVPVHLHAHDTEVIAISHDNPTFTDVPTPPPVPAPASTAALSPVQLADWSLNVDSWTPGPDDLPGDTAHTQLGPVQLAAGGSGNLPAWTAITPANGYSADLQDVSGIGTYTTHVTLGADWSPVHSAQLDLGAVDGTSAVTVNGHALPPLDYTDLAHIEVGPYLRAGDNTITVTVASGLLNAVRVAPGTGASGRKRQDYGLIGPVTLTPTQPLAVEALANTLPLAAGGFNRAQIRITNNTAAPQTVTIDATAPDGITAQPEVTQTRLAGGASTTVGIDLRDASLTSGTSQLHVAVHSEEFSEEVTSTIALSHSSDLARNDLGTPLPRVFASSQQPHNFPALATDSSPGTFWVSYGEVSGQGPTTGNPELLGVDLGAPTQIASVDVTPHGTSGPSSFSVQVSDDGRTWKTVATDQQAASTQTTVTFPVATARYVRLSITDSGDAIRPPRNVQISDFEIYGPH